VGDALDALPSDSLDLVLCIDTTESMKPYLDDLKKNLIVLVRERVGRFREFRIGLVLFKDYWPDDYITMKVPFMTDLSRLDGYIQALKAKGGMDIPEAIHEALVAAATDFEWKAASRLVILVSDAPPHPMPRGQVTWLDAARALAERRIELQALVIPEVELSQ
jgi:Mg-chelatase subunit ChlD